MKKEAPTWWLPSVWSGIDCHLTPCDPRPEGSHGEARPAARESIRETRRASRCQMANSTIDPAATTLNSPFGTTTRTGRTPTDEHGTSSTHMAAGPGTFPLSGDPGRDRDGGEVRTSRPSGAPHPRQRSSISQMLLNADVPERGERTRLRWELNPLRNTWDDIAMPIPLSLASDGGSSERWQRPGGWRATWCGQNAAQGARDHHGQPA